MSVALSDSHQLLCKDLNIATSFMQTNSSSNEDFIEEKIWRKDPKGIIRKWKKENVVFRRSLHGIELFSQDDDSFTILV